MSTATKDTKPNVPDVRYAEYHIDGKILIDLSCDSPDPQKEHEVEDFGDWSDGESEIYRPDDSDDDTYIPPPVLSLEAQHDLPNVIQRMLLLLIDCILKTNFAALLCGTERNGDYAGYCHCCVQLPNGNYVLRPHYRALFTIRLVACAGLIAAALNNHLVVDNRGFIPEILPVTVPMPAMRQCHLHGTPSILLFLSRGWSLAPREFATEAEIKQHVEHFREILRFGIAIFAKIVITAIRTGHQSLVNPGAGIGMAKHDFIQRVKRWTHPNLDLIEAWFDIMLDSNAYLRNADDAAGAFFAPRSMTYLLDIEDETEPMKTLIPHTPHEMPANIPSGRTHRIGTTSAKLGQQLAICGF